MTKSNDERADVGLHLHNGGAVDRVAPRPSLAASARARPRGGWGGRGRITSNAERPQSHEQGRVHHRRTVGPSSIRALMVIVECLNERREPTSLAGSTRLGREAAKPRSPPATLSTTQRGWNADDWRDGMLAPGDTLEDDRRDAHHAADEHGLGQSFTAIDFFISPPRLLGCPRQQGRATVFDRRPIAPHLRLRRVPR